MLEAETVVAYPGLALKHLTDYLQRSDDDAEWLPLLEEDKDWIVITADRGKDSKKEKLPKLCSQLKITHVSMTYGFHIAGYAAHRHALLSLFPQFVCLGLLPKGTRVSLGFRPYHQRNWPYLLVGKHPLDAWCLANAIQLPGLIIDQN